LIRKNGEPDRRSKTSKENIKKSRVYQALQENKTMMKNVVVESSSEDEFEYEIVEKAKKEKPDKPVKPEKPEVKKQVADIPEEPHPEQKFQEELELLKAENFKLKKAVDQNKHLSKINNLSRQITQMRF
jgi:hypothetical protein